jgi:hypothetical protein
MCPYNLRYQSEITSKWKGISKESTGEGHFGPYNLKETKKEREQGDRFQWFLRFYVNWILLLLLLYTLRNNRERETVYILLSLVFWSCEFTFTGHSHGSI